MKKLKYILFLSLIVLISCKGKEGGGGDGGVDPPPPVPAPTIATLSAPAKDSECLDGENVEFVGVLRADSAARVDGQPDGTAGNEPLPSRL